MAETISSSTAAATAVVGYDLWKDQANNKKPYNRVIYGLWFTGSAAAGDAEVAIYVGTDEKHRQFNTTTGITQTREHMIPVRILVPANTQIRAVVTDAPGTNPVLCVGAML